MKAVWPVWEESEGQQTLHYENNSIMSEDVYCTHDVVMLWHNSFSSGTVLQVLQWWSELTLLFSMQKPNKNGKVQETVMMVLSYGSVFRLTTETVATSETKWRRTYCLTVKWLRVLPHFECPQWPLPLVVPPPHAHDPPDMQTSLLSSHPGVGQQQLELTDMKSMN